MTDFELLRGNFEFDWYQASIEATPEEIMRCLFDDHGGISYDTCRGIAQYEQGMRFMAGSNELALLSWGGNQGAVPNLRSVGYYARFIGPEVQKQFPGRLRVSRVDSCFDFRGEGLFDVVQAYMDKIHLETGVKRGSAGFKSPENGRTFYLGTREKGGVLCRLYEKGLKEISEGNLEADPTWCRLELEVRPKTNQKGEYASKSCKEVWGARKWSRQLIFDVTGLELEGISQMPPVNKTEEAKIRYMLNQYQRALVALGKKRVEELMCEEVFYKQVDQNAHERAWSLDKALPLQ